MHPNNQLQAESEVAHCASFLAMLHSLHGVTNKETWIHSTQKIWAESMHCLRQAILHYHESIPSFVSEKIWNTKEDKGKSMIHALYIL